MINKLLSILVLSLSFSCGLNIHKDNTLHKDDYLGDGVYYAGEFDNSIENVKFEPAVTPTDSYYNTQKNYSMSTLGNIETAWDSYTGKGTKIAIIDDGFLYSHPEYIRADSSSAISDESRYYYTVGNYVYNYKYSESPDKLGPAYDSNNKVYSKHGTNTSTTAAAPIGNGGVVGIAPDAEILLLKVDMLLSSIYYAIDYAVDCGVDVINISIVAYAQTFTGDDGVSHTEGISSNTASYLNYVCNKAYNNGVIIVAAAGNDATTTKAYPACNPHVIGVGALGNNTTSSLARFTNYNTSETQADEKNVDILAPGYVYAASVNTSDGSTATYTNTQGTSFSSPIVAGAACLWKEENPDGTPDEFYKQLTSSAAGIGDYNDMKTYCNKDCNISSGRLDVQSLLNPYADFKKSSFNLLKGDSDQIKYNAINGTPTYHSQNSSVATVNSDGLITAVNSGSTNVEVTITTSDNKTQLYNIPVTVNIPTVTFDDDHPTLQVGETLNLVPKVDNVVVAGMFDSRDDEVATVDEDTGVVTAIKAGTTIIDFLSYDSEEGIVFLTVTDTSATVSSVTVTPNVLALDTVTNKTGNLNATVNGDNDPPQTVEWSSSNENVATVDSSGQVTAVADGSCTITATSVLDNTKSGSCAVTVTTTLPSGDYEKITSTSDLEDGEYLIVYEAGNRIFNGALTALDSTNNYVGVTIDNHTIESTSTTDASNFTIIATTDGYYIKSASSYYIGRSANSNGLDSSTTSSSGLVNTINFTSGNAIITGTGTKQLLYNTSSGQDRFRYMGSGGAIQLYKRAAASKVLDHITAVYSGEDIYQGGNLNNNDITVTAYYSDNTHDVVTTGYTLSGFSSATTGVKEVTVSYTYKGVNKTTTFYVTVIEDTLQSITATCSKSYHPGESIVKNDVSVTAHYMSGGQSSISDFTFTTYQFTYNDAPSGGTAGSKEFNITYGGKSDSFSVNVSRIEYETPVGVSDTLTRATTEVTSGSTSYSNWSGKTLLSGSTYAGNSAGDHDSIQLRSNYNNSGIVMTASAGKVKSVTVTWNGSTQSGRVIEVYGKNTAYSAATDLYDNTNKGTSLGTIAYDSQTSLTITGDYLYIGIRSTSGALYLTNVTISFGGGEETLYNVANYIMYEDTNNQCVEKLPEALKKINNMSQEDQEDFFDEDNHDYVIESARTRLNAWAASQNKVITKDGDKYVLSMNYINEYFINNIDNEGLIVLVIFLSTSFSLLSCLILKTKKN